MHHVCMHEWITNCMDNYVAIATCMSQLTLGHALKAALEKLRHVSPQEISV